MFEVENWGLIDYEEAWARQMELVKSVQENRDRNVLVLCQHPTVITIGKNGTNKNVVANHDFLTMMGVKVIDIDRGGDVTLHNPGQMVGYPIFNLSSYKEDLHWFLREIEQTIIDLTSVFGIESARVEGMTGVWVESKRKICAMGMHCSRWVTYHGFALNVNNKVREFDYIVPCGIQDKGVTSIEIETGTVIELGNVVNECIKSFEKHF